MCSPTYTHVLEAHERVGSESAEGIIRRYARTDPDRVRKSAKRESGTITAIGGSATSRWLIALISANI